MAVYPRKSCSVCGRELPYSRFYYHPCTKLHLQSQCKDCQKALVISHQHELQGPLFIKTLSGGITLTYFSKSLCVRIAGPFDSQEIIRKIVAAFDRKRIKEEVDNSNGRIIITVYFVHRRVWDAVVREI